MLFNKKWNYWKTKYQSFSIRTPDHCQPWLQDIQAPRHCRISLLDLRSLAQKDATLDLIMAKKSRTYASANMPDALQIRAFLIWLRIASLYCTRMVCCVLRLVRLQLLRVYSRLFLHLRWSWTLCVRAYCTWWTVEAPSFSFHVGIVAQILRQYIMS